MGFLVQPGITYLCTLLHGLLGFHAPGPRAGSGDVFGGFWDRCRLFWSFPMGNVCAFASTTGVDGSPSTVLHVG